MSAGAVPVIKLHPLLSTADGSATYTSPSSTHTLTCGVNYPLEVPYRSDEDPESTYIEVSLRPHNGVSMVKERFIEEVVSRTLKAVVLGEDTPRCMLQCTIQVMEMQDDEALPGGIKGGYQGENNLDLLVGALNASVLGCLDAAVKMRGLVGAVLIGITEDETIITSPDVKERLSCESLHAYGFDSNGKCVLMESEGDFDLGTWERAESIARQTVCGKAASDTGIKVNGSKVIDMESSERPDCLFSVIRSSFESRCINDERWNS